MTAALATAGLRTIRVYGTLARLLGRREMRAMVSTVPEAMRFLVANFPQVEGHLKGRFFKVKVANWSLTEHDLEAPVGQTETIHIIPAICGAGGDGPLVGILAGAALLGIGLLVPFGGSVLVPLGIGLLLNGVAALLSPTPGVTDEDNDPARSYNFSGIQQNSREGIPVPLVYGDIVTGSVVLSVNIEEDEEELGASVGGDSSAGGDPSAGGDAAAANALFVAGQGNPNPNPSPVPDEDLDINPADYPGGWRWYIFLGSEVVSFPTDVGYNGDGRSFLIADSAPHPTIPARRIPYLAYGEEDGNWIANISVDIEDTTGSGIVFVTGRQYIVDYFNNQIGDIQYVYNFYKASESDGPFELSGYFELYKTTSDYADRRNAVIWRGVRV